MKFLRNLSIRRKLMAIAMFVSSASLLVACAAFLAYEQTAARKQMVQALSITAAMTAANSTAGLSFDEAGSVGQALQSLSVQPDIIEACVYDKKGVVFARYARAGTTTNSEPPTAEKAGWRFDRQRLVLFQSITLAGETIGSICLEQDLSVITSRLRLYGLIGLAVLLMSATVAFILSMRLQRVISEPISGLAETVNLVRANKNYSVRVARQGGDELGHLIDGFNEMLAQIQERDNNLERRVAEQTRELRESEANYYSLVDQMPAGIFRKDKEGRYIFVNSWFCRAKGIKPENFLGKLPHELGAGVGTIVAKDGPGYQELAEVAQEHHARILATGSQIEDDEQWPASDGRIRYFRVVRSPVHGSEGVIVGTQGVLLDVTAIKEAEEQLKAAHQRLLETSRLAGMAEVATSVLHNVGNVLNSVNVSTTLVLDLAKKSRVNSVGRLAAMIQERAGDLGAFFTTDTRGKQIPDYLFKLAQHLESEQAELVAEIELTRNNVEHIKDIVAMQQSYAKVSGVVEKVKATDLVEDALRMNAGALSRHQVKVVRDYPASAVECSVERQKVLQILTNLIRNAKYACDESSRQDKQMVMQVRAQDDRVHIITTDNGVGIPAENITRIFNFGFTTRDTGHGFGLHSSALAAKEMGGSLTAYSAGPGAGARFVLDLPLNAPRNL